MGTTFYYHVFVRSAQYRGTAALTYSCQSQLAIGSLVRVPLRAQAVPGIVVGTTPRPRFPTKMIGEIFAVPPIPLRMLALARWLQEFYPAPVGVITSLIIPANIRQPIPDAADEPRTDTAAQPPLTAGQQAALDDIRTPDTYLLHGRTGSGKTRIYTELAERTLTGGQSVLVLSPEIGLTSQLAHTFTARFGKRVVVLHSRMTAKERETTWMHILTARTPLIVIGPRSALFAPLNALGCIIVDEAHDAAYKQEQPPYYQAVRVASHLARLHQAVLVLGSATPGVSDYYLAQIRHKPIIRLDTLARSTPHERRITIVDMKDRTQFTRAPHLSRPLIEAIAGSLRDGEQSLLYLNRRGTARVALCQQCGWQARCPRCDIPLTYHGDSHQLMCHTCGYHQAGTTSCPACGSPELTFSSFGTKAIVDEVQRLFPEARIARFDTDNTRADRLEMQYTSIAEGSVDILVGTQMLAKGLDLPRLSTLGVVTADSSLYIPDYTAQERTYQLISQVVGRIGRGHLQGHAIIQTYQPESPLLRAAIDGDWDTFYASEIAQRQQYGFPPFTHVLKLTCTRASAAAAENASGIFAAHLRAGGAPLTIDGPAPAFHEKAGGKYKWQIVLRAKNRSTLLAAIGQLPANGWSYDLDPADLL